MSKIRVKDREKQHTSIPTGYFYEEGDYSHALDRTREVLARKEEGRRADFNWSFHMEVASERRNINNWPWESVSQGPAEL